MHLCLCPDNAIVRLCRWYKRLKYRRRDRPNFIYSRRLRGPFDFIISSQKLNFGLKGDNNDRCSTLSVRIPAQRSVRMASEGCIAGAFQIIRSCAVRSRRNLDRYTRAKVDQPETLVFKGVLFTKECVHGEAYK